MGVGLGSGSERIRAFGASGRSVGMEVVVSGRAEGRKDGGGGGGDGDAG